jgi:DNA-binding NarL/FixJ family response regulator
VDGCNPSGLSIAPESVAGRKFCAAHLRDGGFDTHSAPISRPTPIPKIRVLVVDDQPLFRAGVVATVQQHAPFEVCGEVSQIQAAREVAARLRPDAAIIDPMLQHGDGLKLVRDLRRELSRMNIVVLTMLDPVVFRPRAFQAGANHFVSKRAGADAVVAALRQAGSGHRPSRAKPEANHELSTLSERELQVFFQLGQGRSTQEVAAALGVSVKTIESHRENIKGKLGLPHGNALVARAALWVREQGLMT